MRKYFKFLQLLFLSFFVVSLAGCGLPSFLIRQAQKPVYREFQGSVYNTDYWSENSKQAVQEKMKKEGIALMVFPLLSVGRACGIQESNQISSIFNQKFSNKYAIIFNKKYYSPGILADRDYVFAENFETGNIVQKYGDYWQQPFIKNTPITVEIKKFYEYFYKNKAVDFIFGYTIKSKKFKKSINYPHSPMSLTQAMTQTRYTQAN